MQIYVITGTNNADFNESTIVVAGKSLEAAERQFSTVIIERWDNTLNQDDKEFYSTCDKYEEAWTKDYNVCGLAE